MRQILLSISDEVEGLLDSILSMERTGDGEEAPVSLVDKAQEKAEVRERFRYIPPTWPFNNTTPPKGMTQHAWEIKCDRDYEELCSKERSRLRIERARALAEVEEKYRKRPANTRKVTQASMCNLLMKMGAMAYLESKKPKARKK